jgi:hypothetical protein
MGEAPRQMEHKPLLKLHGCASRNRDEILWSRKQIVGAQAERSLVDRIEFWRLWLQAHLQGRDLVIVGFWTDWAYLNGVLENALGGINPAVVYLIDPVPAADLNKKAPGLWSLAHRDGVQFHHIQQSGADFLKELRDLFNRKFFQRTLHQSISTFKALIGAATVPKPMALPAEITSAELYELRRDLCGIPNDQVVRQKTPTADMELVGAAHLGLMARGAVLEGTRYRTANGETVRVADYVVKSGQRTFEGFEPVWNAVPQFRWAWVEDEALGSQCRWCNVERSWAQGTEISELQPTIQAVLFCEDGTVKPPKANP